MEISFKAEIGGKTLTIQAGKVAKQASGSVVVQYGDTIVLVAAVSSHEERLGVDFLPLSVEYQEKIYAAGRIPGNYFRREIGRPSEKETLTARLIDRPIRPLFPQDYNYETQVIATVLSMDQENDPDVLAMIGAFIGWQGVLFTIFVASAVGTLSGVLVMLSQKKGLKLAIPFGPFLSIGAIAYVFMGPALISWYFNLLR